MGFEKRLLMAWALLAWALPGRAEDLTIVAKETKDGGSAETRTSYIASDHIRMASERADSIIDLTTGTITVIDHNKREYFVMTKQDMDAMAQQAEAAMKQVETQMANLPPAIREKMQSLGGQAAAAVSVQKGTGGRTIAGLACENWVVTIGQMSKQDTCVTTQLTFPVAAFDAYKNLTSTMGGMASSLSKSMGSVWDKFKEMKGYPLYSSTKVTLPLGKGSTTTTEVTEIRKGPIAASTWSTPAGYRQVESPMKKALERKGR